MNRTHITCRLLVATATALAVALTTGGPAGAQPVPADQAERRLQQALDRVVAAGAPGAVLLDRHGSRTTRLASGFADPVEGRRMRVDDRFRAASQMKSFTAVVVLQLVQEGRLRLDDQIDVLLPGVVPHGYGAGVTVRHLLLHNSGLFDFGDDPRVLAPYFAGDLGHVWTPPQLLAIAFEHPPLFPPGTRFSYADTGYFLLAYIVEAVTGHAFGDELRRRILRPLGLRGTDLPTVDAIAGRHAHGYIVFGDPPADTDVTALYPFSWAAGGLTSTAHDSARFYRALFAGRLLSPALIREMKTTIEVTDSDLPSRSGLGVQRWTPCGVAWGHSGNAPGYLVYTWISPDTQHETVLMINEDPQSVGPQALAEYYDLLDRAYCRRP
ncbi:serine hydrolase domain-containing protein [Paractinoplanes maris]|uniref:serine hydrolase domain-containing protein n=1 Tax=Paractinoplanes maris TaxID=1734446 RepID=UPI0020220F81|nr:serine hydrolase domain-containing protein [Actinoplanes maris]